MAKLEGKIALISGAGRGIGRSIALKLASEGTLVVVNDLEREAAEETVAAIKTAGGNATASPGDVTAPDFAERFVGLAVAQYGGVDIIVNNAGYPWDNVIHKMSDQQWEALIDVHMTAPFRILRAAAGFIRQAHKTESEAGREVFRKVVNISSIVGLGGNAGQVNYSAAKAGVVGLTLALAKEWGRYRVNVNCIAFGLIKTRLTQLSAGPASKIEIDGNQIRIGGKPELMTALERLIPLERFGTPEEAAGAVYLLCIPESNYISGHTLVCSGGLTI
jgi:3-oxoacyl-[acyl-carrier protein] reductase